jgi:hypothetical protein
MKLKKIDIENYFFQVPYGLRTHYHLEVQANPKNKIEGTPILKLAMVKK